jgi:hypothetical protein
MLTIALAYEWHKLPIKYDDTSPGVINQPSHEFFQATHPVLAQYKFSGPLLTEKEMGRWNQFISPISSPGAWHFPQASGAAVAIEQCTDYDTLLEMTSKEKALMAQKRKEADISEEQATNATAHPPVKEIAHSADREGVPALAREEAYPTSAKSRSQSLVSTTSESNNATQLSLDLLHVSPTRNNTLSSFTEDDTDWGEDESTGSLQDLHFADFSPFSQEGLISQDQMKETLMRPVFSPVREELVDRIMKEFWAIFDQESGTYRL